jgi:hypothetical protein
MLIIAIQIFILCLITKNYIIFLYLYSIFVILFIIFELKNVKFETVVGENGHLRWIWLESNIYWLIIVITFYLITNLFFNNLRFIFTFTILLISLYYYYEYKTWSTMWCYYSNFLWIYFILYSIIIKIIHN